VVPSVNQPGAAAIPDVRIFDRRVARDARGFFSELWRDNDAQAAGLPPFVQDNVAKSGRGVVRGLHFQHPSAQAKLVSVPYGEVFDVVVDVRVGSPTFGRWYGYTLSEENARQLFVPPGFAHGYQTTSETSVVVYKCSAYYAPEHERTLRWNDPALAIPWPIVDAVASARDAAARPLRELPADWLPRLDR